MPARRPGRAHRRAPGRRRGGGRREAAARRPRRRSPRRSRRPRSRPAGAAGPTPRRGSPSRSARPRHWALLASFLLLVVVPGRRLDHLPLHPRRAAVPLGHRLLGPLRGARLGRGRRHPRRHHPARRRRHRLRHDILFDYIRSQEIVEAIDGSSTCAPSTTASPDDWASRSATTPRSRSCSTHWQRMVTVTYENHAGIIEVRANAFTPEDAQAIAQAILEEVERAGEPALPSRRATTRCASPARSSPRPRHTCATCARSSRTSAASTASSTRRADVARRRPGSSTRCRSELAKAMVERDMLLTYADAKRPAGAAGRTAGSTAISERIEDERDALGAGGVAGALPEVVGDYEALQVDLEIASTAYTQALGRPDARRRGRGAAAVALPRAAHPADAGRELALPAPGAALRAGRALPPARLGRADARLLQCARQPLSGRAGRADGRPAMIEFRDVSKYYLTQHRPEGGARPPDPGAAARRQGGAARPERRRQVDAARDDRRHGPAQLRRASAGTARSPGRSASPAASTPTSPGRRTCASWRGSTASTPTRWSTTSRTSPSSATSSTCRCAPIPPA